ncbi:hypothetical protein G6L46_15505 [Agrobacterium rhizogenes]|uniref:hypothetical protein n=1 Tax=Rhizobium rhizogenes TaxID=359 RepID=UPI001572BDD7|nr:hypothetical protein [Rhizobium rhizogenes]NTF88536.1 hypothetical protein [Rhizobium rhizogenes]
MSDYSLEITEMFRELVNSGKITPVERMEDLRFPGELPYIPTIATYGTPDLPSNVGTNSYAQLEQRTAGDFRPASYSNRKST